ncbi:MAG: isoleucine--tRNA ligase [Actinobacteria bacterium]|nr:isoleucine--tRNA ligase [Actinomycetota bacterium]
MPEPRYPEVPNRIDLPAVERRLLNRWNDERTFERSVDQRSDAEFVFYDGPPFANGLPHYGHLLTGYVKDVVPRYQTMRGRRVERRFGWDCHGLPAEMVAEQELGVSGHARIAEFGIDRFNDHCRTSVLRYTDEWERYVSRQARWVDFDDDYKTMDLSYMESVIWAFEQLWNRGLIYEAYRVMPYSWGAETPLSNFEIRLDDATRPRQDPAITVAFTLEDDRPAALSSVLGDGPAVIWAWTTTPWTLPSNLALAVGDDIDYDVVEATEGPWSGYRVIVGARARERYERELPGDARVLGTLTGRQLVGTAYRPVFPYFADHPGSFSVLADPFVTDDDGTGVVHLAPGFGEDDQRVCEAAGIALVCPVDDRGAFSAEVIDYAGTNVFDANPQIIADLKDRGIVVRHDTYDHNYPHCWRTDTPIIYKAVNSWYVEVTAIRDRLVELNQEVNWIPEHVRDGQFGKWLEGARDWSISRNRFWGAPIPVWRSDDPAHPRTDVYGSLAAIEADFGVALEDLHRPAIDALTRPNPDDPSGQSTMRRVPEVLDCWFESGSMPFAQVHYPFEQRDWFDSHAPADFIVEYIAQTRGWFYTMHVLSGALFDRPAFRNVICHGVVLDHEGRKLSKKLRNYPDPLEVMETIGSDPLRWYLMASPILRGGDLRISTDGAEISDVVRLVVNPIWNAYSFFTTYANAENVVAVERTDAPGVLDRYILAKTRELVEDVTAQMDAYDIAGACGSIQTYLDALTNWYIRRSRERFWAPGDEATPQASRDAFDTLYTVLRVLVRVAAPLLPFVAEEIFTGLQQPSVSNTTESVHLQDWPDPESLPADSQLVAAMDRLRDACSVALGLREDHRLRARLPLRRLTFAGRNPEELSGLVDLLRDEVNVKEVVLSDDPASIGEMVLRPDARALGPRLGSAVQHVLAAARNGDWVALADGRIQVAGEELSSEDYDLAFRPVDGSVAAALRSHDGVVQLDVQLDDELISEGRARDVVRLVQQARKDAGLAVTDRITAVISSETEVIDAIDGHRQWIAAQVLAVDLELESAPPSGVIEAVGTTDGIPVGVQITLAPVAPPAAGR